MSVMVLGWSWPLLNPEKPSFNTLNIAEALAKQLKVSLILPQASLAPAPNNIELIGLNNINLETIPVSNREPENYPFADQHIAPVVIPLYGTPVYTGQQHTQFRPIFSGEGLTTGPMNREMNQTNPEQEIPSNIFHPDQFQKLSLSMQVIQYARFTSRFANQKSFKIIYAHDFPTFLAGTELKLRSGKKLVLELSDINFLNIGSENGGWLYILGKYALDKSDVIIAKNGAITAVLVEDYGINLNKIITLQPTKEVKTNEPETENLLDLELLNKVAAPVPQEILEILLGLGGIKQNEAQAAEEILLDDIVLV